MKALLLSALFILAITAYGSSGQAGSKDSKGTANSKTVRLLDRSVSAHGDEALRLIEAAAWAALEKKDSPGLELALDFSIDEFRWITRNHEFRSALTKLLAIHAQRGRLTAFGARVEAKLAEFEAREGDTAIARERFGRLLDQSKLTGFMVTRNLDRTLVGAVCFQGLTKTDPERKGEPVNPYWRDAAEECRRTLPWSVECGALYMRAGWNFSAAGDHPHAMEYFEGAARIFEKTSPGSLWEAEAYGNSLAERIAVRRAQPIQAEVDDVSRRYGAAVPDWGRTALALKLEAEGASKRGDFVTALERYGRAIQLMEAHLGGPDLNRLSATFFVHLYDAYSGAGWALRAQDKDPQAERYFELALACTQAWSGGNAESAGVLNNQARMYLERRALVEADNAIKRLGVEEPDLRGGARAGGFEAGRSAANLLGLYRNRGVLAYLRGDIAAARTLLEEALALGRDAEKLAAGPAYSDGHLIDLRIVREYLARVYDELGLRDRAIPLLREAAAAASADPRSIAMAQSYLARLLLEGGDPAEAQKFIQAAKAFGETSRSLPNTTGPEGFSRPQTRYLSPPDNAEVSGDRVDLQLVLVSPIPVKSYRLWVNGRELGDGAGFDIPSDTEKGRLLDKGRLLEKGRLLDKSGDREEIAKELPANLAALVKLPQNAHFLQIRQTVPLEEIDGVFVRVAIQVETTGGSVSDREILRLRRPRVEQARGSLRVLSVGIGDYTLLPRLKYAAADAVSLADAFRAQAGLESGTSLYKGANIQLLVNSEATLAQIRESLDALVANSRPGDTVVLALSGHGIAVRPPAVDLAKLPLDAMMAMKPAPTQTYFAPVRFDPENPAGTGLPWPEIVAKLEPLRKVAKTVWLLADCCRSAPGLRRMPTPDMPLRKGEVLAADTRDLKRGLDEGGNLILCAASDADTPSYESDDLKHGIFTQAWLEALRGEAPDLVYQEAPRGKVLTLSGLQFWLDASVTKHARKAGVRQRVEFPRLEGSFSPSTPVFVAATRN